MRLVGASLQRRSSPLTVLETRLITCNQAVRKKREKEKFRSSYYADTRRGWHRRSLPSDVCPRTGTGRSTHVITHSRPTALSCPPFICRFFSTALQDDDDRLCQHDTSLSVAIDPPVLVDVIKDGSALSLSFDPDTHSVYHAPWLWCNDPTYVHPSSRQKLRSPGQYRGTKIISASIISSMQDIHSADRSVLPIPPPPPSWCHPIAGGLSLDETQIEQQGGTQNYDVNFLSVTWDSHQVSYYDLNWLRHWRYDHEALVDKKHRSQVTKRHAIRRVRETEVGIPTIQYSSLLLQGDDAIFELLHAIVQRGAALVQGAPLLSSGSALPVSTLGKRLGGWLSHGALYGDVFHVKSVPNANNIAYTSVALRPHQDLAYYESPPGLQLLHCVNNNGIEGGESVLIDALAAAHELRRIAPKHFATLKECPATFVKQREEADMVCRRPHIVTDASGEVVMVNWSPPFEGPLCLPVQMIERYYDAYAAFELILDNTASIKIGNEDAELSHALANYANEYTWQRKLKPGEMLVFNNRRMLHARRSFSLIPGAAGTVGRHLVGCYTNIDDTLSRYRLLLRERSNDEPVQVLNVGNGTNAVQ